MPVGALFVFLLVNGSGYSVKKNCFCSKIFSKFFFRQKVIFFDVDSINRLDIGIRAEKNLGNVFFSTPGVDTIFFLGILIGKYYEKIDKEFQ